MPFQPGPLAAVLLFGALFLIGSTRLIPPALRRHRRKMLSFGAGVTIAYVFVHLLPELEGARIALVRTGAQHALPFPALRVYLAALIGFMLFYGLEYLVTWSKASGSSEEEGETGSRTVRLIHTGGLLLYVWLAGYLTVRSLEEGATPIALYAVALGLHFLSLDASLHREYGVWYDRLMRFAFVAAVLAGWTVGIVAEFGQAFSAALLGLLSGGIIMNSIIGELPKKKEGKFIYFLLGGVFYTVLLILLS